MKYYHKIDGEKIYLSPVNMEDIDKYTKWFNDFEVTKGVHATQKLVNQEQEKESLEQLLLKSPYTFAIVRKDNDKLIGNCSLNKVNFLDGTATIGIFIGEEENRNKGYGTDTIRTLLKYGFDIINLHNIDLKVFSFNEGAIKCYQKAGLKEYGRKHECYYLNNKYYDEIYMEILRDDFYNN